MVLIHVEKHGYCLTYINLNESNLKQLKRQHESRDMKYHVNTIL